MRALAFALVLAVPAVSAQTDWRPAPTTASVSADALFAVGDDFQIEVTDEQGNTGGSDVIAVTSSVVLLSGRAPVGAGWTVLAEVPLAYAGYAGRLPGGTTYNETDTALGNPFVGVERAVGTQWTLGAGVRVPVYGFDTRAFGWQGGMTADRERFEAYLPDVLTVSASAAVTVPVAPAVRLSGRLAPALAIDVSGAENTNGPDNTGLVLGYGVRAEGAVGPLALHGGVVGRPVVSGDRFRVFDTVGTAVLGASVEVAGVRPGVLARVPLDGSVYTQTDATLGLTLDVPLR